MPRRYRLKEAGVFETTPSPERPLGAGSGRSTSHEPCPEAPRRGLEGRSSGNELCRQASGSAEPLAPSGAVLRGPRGPPRDEVCRGSTAVDAGDRRGEVARARRSWLRSPAHGRCGRAESGPLGARSARWRGNGGYGVQAVHGRNISHESVTATDSWFHVAIGDLAQIHPASVPGARPERQRALTGAAPHSSTPNGRARRSKAAAWCCPGAT